jgi:hypothetical protein
MHVAGTFVERVPGPTDHFRLVVHAHPQRTREDVPDDRTRMLTAAEWGQ